MADQNPQGIASELLAANFKRSSNNVSQLSDPIVDTPMVITLDELRPYELNPRVTKNPLYDDIKASVRERGLDAPPAITKRPSAEHYIIRNGGNTRLTILNELWKETKDKRFFTIQCMFRPWQNEIVALTGHLAENELHGALTFIEKALAVAKARELYEEREQREVSQREIAKLLSEDGFPINQSDVSRMGDAMNHLLPFIPTVLYGGLGPRVVAQLLSFRKSIRAAWDKYAEKLHPDPESLKEDEELAFGIHGTFADVFGETLHRFDDTPEKFNFNRFQDELVWRLSQIFECTYDEISLDVIEKSRLQKALTMPPEALPIIDEAALLTKPGKQVLIPDEEQIIQMQLPKAPREPVQK
ncbi:MAG: ParB family protein, partial [Saezia sp.]